MDKKSYKTLNISKVESLKTPDTVELLAPAKDISCAMTAINCGADAIYIGASNFGARKKAGNSLEDIKKIVDYAHLFNVKIYVTVNTVIFDNELNEVEKLINDLYEIGVDALIIQDLGILKLNLPPISLHASTQCHNINVEKIKFLQSLNISRFVLPREMTLDEIKEIKEKTGAELEFFVHGALCVSYSGQCYLSQKIGGRSANRGECAQPCRNRYSLVDENEKYLIKNKYLLSLKDFCLIDNLKELVNSGVYSFKIEGRLKDEDYIKTTVCAYREKLEQSGIKKSSLGVIFSDFKPDLKKVFNRGFTKYNIKENEDINSADTPKNKGEYIGIVKNIFKNGFETDLKKGITLHPNDGICTFINDDLKGSTITKIQNNKIFLLSDLNLKIGDKIYRNLDFEYQKYAKKTQVQRKLPIKISVFTDNSNIMFKMSYNKISVDTKIKNNFEPAKNEQKAVENLTKQFLKLGETVFCTDRVDIKGIIPFIPISEMNEIRRELTIKLKQKILDNYKFIRREVKYSPTKFPKTIKNDYRLNITNKKAEQVYKESGLDEPGKGFEVSSHIKNAVLMQTKNCLRKFASICSKNCKYNKKLFLEDSFGNKYPLKFDCKNCVMEILNYE